MWQKRLCLLLAAVCCCCGCNGRETVPVLSPQGEVYVALGDSICRGYRLDDPTRERYSTLLGEALGYTVYNYGTDGLTGEGLREQLRAGLPKLQDAALITVSIGGNHVLGAAFPVLQALLAVGSGGLTLDGVNARISESVSAFESELPAILSALRRQAPQAVILLQTVYNPYASFDHVQVGLEGGRLSLASFADACVQRVNDILRAAAAREENVLVCDVYAVFREASDSGKRPVNATPIGLVFDPHPNALGHRLIAQACAELLKT